MEVSLRCAVPDRPGALSALAGAIGAAGGDIEAVEVVDADGEQAVDDLVVVVEEGGLVPLVDALEQLDGVTLLHAAPSRGHPGDAVTRLAVGVQALLDGAAATEQGVASVVGGLLEATSIEVLDASTAPRNRPKRLVLDFGDRRLVVRRDYPFTARERQRATALAGLCATAATLRDATRRIDR